MFYTFSFKALNCSDGQLSCDLDSSNISSPNVHEYASSPSTGKITKASLPDNTEKEGSKNADSACVFQSTNLSQLSPNVTSLLKPTKTRESEEVRITKLYHIALRLCSSDCHGEDFKARPVLESILNSFIIEGDKLTPQLTRVKFASCKLLGGIYFKLNRHAEGIDLLSKALQIDSNDLSLWIRLARAGIRSGFFEVAINSIEHILTKRPSHPVALHLALPLYFAVSELEICLELSTRMLQIDPSSEYAVYFINRILTIQPSLHEMVTDLFLQRPDILNQLPASKEAEQVDQEIQKIRTIYRKQKDAEMESQVIPVIKFPSPLKHLSWLHLIKETVTMYDHLQAESTIHLVLDLSSLWSEDLLREIKESSTSNADVHSNLKTVEQSGSDNNNNTTTGHMEDPHTTKVPSSTDTTSELVNKDDVNELNMEAGTDDLATGIEKRRSARVRTCFDLSDGLNRYCSRRSVTMELDKVVYEKCKASTGEKFTNSSQKDGNNPNDRFKLADQFQTLLPQIFRDLAAYNRKQKISQEVQLSTENSMNDNNSTTNEVVSVNSEQVTLNQSNLWSPKSVHNFLIMLNGMKPNIVTFGISLLLQTSQLSGCRWSSELATAYRNLFHRLQPSFPYFLTIPPSNSLLMDTVSQMTKDADTCLLPECVLALRRPPEIKHLAYFYLIYIEIHLEELEANPNSTTGSKGRNLLVTEISTSLFSVLNEILSKFEETSSDYPIIMSHLLWIDYLMCSRRRDYTEMQECVLALQKHLLTHKIVVSRAYSVRHGDLTLDYMNRLLSKLKDVSSFDRLIQLSHDGQHADVVVELTRIFQLQRGTNSKSSSSSSSASSYSSSSSTASSLSSSDQSHSLKQLNLFYNSLKHLITDMITKTGDYTTPREGNNTAGGGGDVVDMEVTPSQSSSSSGSSSLTASSLSSYYNYCILLIEECLLRLTESNQEQMMTLSEASVNSIASTAMKTIKFLIKCWNLLEDNSTDENDLNSRQFPIKSNSSNDISSIVNLPLKLLTCIEDSGDNNSNNNNNNNSEGGVIAVPAAIDRRDEDATNSVELSISEACRTVTVITDFLVYSIRTSSIVLSNWTMNFYLKLVSLLYEHLRCIEESIPCSALPIELRIYQSGVELSEEIPLELKLNAYCGSVSAPPSIVCLHLFHEFSILLFTSSIANSNNSNNTIIQLCRDSTGIVKLLIQLAIRSCNELQSISARFYSPDLRWILETGGIRIDATGATTSTTTSTTDDGIVSNAGNTATTNINNNNECSGNKGQTTTDEYMAPISPDDNTVACTDDLQNSSLCSKSWPKGSVCLAQVLSCTIKCLLGNCLTREITTFYQPTEKYLSLDFVESYEFMKIYNCIKTKYGDGFMNFIPEWINTVKNLFDSWDVFDHQQQYQLMQTQQQTQHQQQQLQQSNWWNSPTLSSADCDTHQEECLDWQCVKIIFLFACPSPFPEYDSLKTMSISNEMLKFLCDAAKIMPTCELDKMLPKSSIDTVIQSKAKEIHLPSVPKGLSFLTKSMYYLIADHYMKNNQFPRAVEYYLQDLCVSPQRVDTWAALGLIYSSDLEQILNLTNLKTERISAEAVYRCLRCFNIALHLQPDSVTLLIERGCLAYQLHSYAARIVKKSEYRSFPDVHLNLCRKWRHRMLQLARASYENALNLCSSAKHQRGVETVKVGKSTLTTSSSSSSAVEQQDNNKLNRLAENDLIDSNNNNNNNNNKNNNKADNKTAQSKEEEWLCHYMLAKCAEKDAYLIKQSEDVYPSSRLMHVLRLYHDALKALDSAGAKYPKKIIFYNKIPFRAVEAIEVYYRIHALSLKTLLKCGSPVTSTQSNHSAYPINLVELDQFLAMIDTSEFVTSAKKPCRRNRKRTANMAGLSNKTNQSQKIANQIGPCEGQSSKPMQQNESATMSRINDQLVDVTASKSGQSSDIPLISATIPSQEEFVDLTSPDQPLQEDEEMVNVPSSVESSIDKLTLWEKCVDRCRCALELVLQRLPLHYKAMYRLASMYLYAPHLTNPNKALDILLGPAEVSSKPSSTANNNSNNNTTNASSSTQTNIGGLFKDRKQNNFFYGVWRIPTADIDRSGNFAAHMYRSVSLTLSLLHDQGDWRRLVHIFHQLRKQPPEEKRGFLGEGDRVYLARRAFSLIQPTLFNWLTQLSLSLAHSLSQQISKDKSLVFNSDISSLTASEFITTETLTQIYRLHCVSYARNSSTSSSSSSSPSGQLNSSLNSFNSSLCSPTSSTTTTTTTTATTPSSTHASASSSSNVPDVATVAAAETSGYASVLQLAYRLCPKVWDSRGPLVPLDWILKRCNEISVTKSQREEYQRVQM